MSTPEPLRPPPIPPPVQKKLLPQEFFEFIVNFNKPLTAEEKCAWIGESAWRVLHGQLPQELFVPLRNHIESLPTAIPLPQRLPEKIPGSDYVHDSSKPLNPLIKENPTFISDDLSITKRRIHRQFKERDTPLVLLVLLFVILPLCLIGYGIGTWIMNSQLRKKEKEIAAGIEPVIQEAVEPALIQPPAEVLQFTAEEQAEIDKFCAQYGNDVQATNNNGWTLLHRAVRGDHIAIVKFLVSEGADVNVKDNDGAAPINLAAWRGYAEIVRFLVSQGADVNAKNNGGLTPLHLAAQRGHVEVIEYLVSVGADVKVKRNDNGSTSLHDTAWNGHTIVAKFLVSQGADVNAKNNDGQTPLYHAAWQGHVEVAKFLVSQGVVVNTKSNSGKTPLDVAKEQGHTAVVEYLTSIGGK